MTSKALEATTFLFYVDFVMEQGEPQSRRSCAEAFGVHVSTAMYNLEKAVASGKLIKLPGFVGRQPGWVYMLPEWQPGLFDDERAQMKDEDDAQRRNEESLLYGNDHAPRELERSAWDPLPR